MSEGGYKIRNKAEVHFLSFAVVEWIDVFSRQIYRDILLDSLRYCQDKKGLLLHAWCVMTNHVHLLASSPELNLSGIIGDLKKFTSKEIIRAIIDNKSESRKDWMLRIFREEGEKNSRNKEFQFWRQDNQPKECFSDKFTFQKMNYIIFARLLQLQACIQSEIRVPDTLRTGSELTIQGSVTNVSSWREVTSHFIS